jgi:Xaa-Pro aminopeptidase
MILSNEPGYYLPGAYGIRIENLLLVREAAPRPDQTRPFLEFETLTLAPYCRALIATELLTGAERAWIDAYHARVRDAVSPHCDAATREWLVAETMPC